MLACVVGSRTPSTHAYSPRGTPYLSQPRAKHPLPCRDCCLRSCFCFFRPRPWLLFFFFFLRSNTPPRAGLRRPAHSDIPDLLDHAPGKPVDTGVFESSWGCGGCGGGGGGHEASGAAADLASVGVEGVPGGGCVGVGGEPRSQRYRYQQPPLPLPAASTPQVFHFDHCSTNVSRLSPTCENVEVQGDCRKTGAPSWPLTKKYWHTISKPHGFGGRMLSCLVP